MLNSPGNHGNYNPGMTKMANDLKKTTFELEKRIRIFSEHQITQLASQQSLLIPSKSMGSDSYNRLPQLKQIKTDSSSPRIPSIHQPSSIDEPLSQNRSNSRKMFRRRR